MELSYMTKKALLEELDKIKGLSYTGDDTPATSVDRIKELLNIDNEVYREYTIGVNITDITPDFEDSIKELGNRYGSCGYEIKSFTQKELDQGHADEN